MTPGMHFVLRRCADDIYNWRDLITQQSQRQPARGNNSFIIDVFPVKTSRLMRIAFSSHGADGYQQTLLLHDYTYRYTEIHFAPWRDEREICPSTAAISFCPLKKLCPSLHLIIITCN